MKTKAGVSTDENSSWQFDSSAAGRRADSSERGVGEVSVGKEKFDKEKINLWTVRTVMFHLDYLRLLSCGVQRAGAAPACHLVLFW